MPGWWSESGAHVVRSSLSHPGRDQISLRLRVANAFVEHETHWVVGEMYHWEDGVLIVRARLGAHGVDIFTLQFDVLTRLQVFNAILETQVVTKANGDKNCLAFDAAVAALHFHLLLDLYLEMLVSAAIDIVVLVKYCGDLAGYMDDGAVGRVRCRCWVRVVRENVMEVFLVMVGHGRVCLWFFRLSRRSWPRLLYCPRFWKIINSAERIPRIQVDICLAYITPWLGQQLDLTGCLVIGQVTNSTPSNKRNGVRKRRDLWVCRFNRKVMAEECGEAGPPALAIYMSTTTPQRLG